MSAARRLPLLVGTLALLALTGCAKSVNVPGDSVAASSAVASGAATESGAADIAASGGVAVGPGPVSPYTVEPQPAAGTCHYRHEGSYPLPDAACTPGARNPKVTPQNLASTICRSGYTADIRPPDSVTSREKAANARSYGYTGSMKTAEYDHLISLEIGGDPNDPRNLWVEPNDKPSATGTTNGKDAVENATHTAVCSGRLGLYAAQAQIAADWVALGHSLGLSLPKG